MSHKNGNKKFWTDTIITEEAKRYKTRGEWMKGSPTSYQLSTQDKAKHALNCAHMSWSTYYKNPPPKGKGYWTKERVIEEGLKYSSFTEWKKNSSPSYLIAYRKGWKGEIEAQLFYKGKGKPCKGRKYWTPGRVLAHVSRYSKIATMAEFKRNDRKIYNQAKKHKILRKCKAIICEGSRA